MLEDSARDLRHGAGTKEGEFTVLRRGKTLIISLAALLALVILPAAFPTAASDTGPCADIGMTISYVDPVTGAPRTIVDNPSAKFGVPVNTVLNFTVTLKNPALAGREVKFSSPNQFLQLDTTSISDGGVVKFNPFVPDPAMNPANPRTNVNWEISWAKPNDGSVTFKATIHEDNLDDPTTPALDQDLTKGRLMTIGAKVQGARCSAKIEIYGLPGGGGPGPVPPCPGINVAIYFEANDGNFYPVYPIVQSPTNTQFEGPGVGKRVIYVITSPSPFTGICSRKEARTRPSWRRTRTARSNCGSRRSRGRSSVRRPRPACRPRASVPSQSSMPRPAPRSSAADGDRSAIATAAIRRWRSWRSRRWPESSASAAAAIR